MILHCWVYTAVMILCRQGDFVYLYIVDMNNLLWVWKQLPQSEGRDDVISGTRASRVHRITRRSIVVIVVRLYNPDVRHFAVIPTLTVPVAKLVSGHFSVRAGTKLMAAHHFCVVTEPVLRPIHVGLAASASRAFGFHLVPLTVVPRV